MQLKTLTDSGNVILQDYTVEECRMILFERNSYVLQRIHSFGNDYGGSHCTDERVETFEEIPAECILVKKGHFAGVALIADYDDCGPHWHQDLHEALMLIDGSGEPHVRSGSSFSNDDHSRWDYVDRYLMERGEAERLAAEKK